MNLIKLTFTSLLFIFSFYSFGQNFPAKIKDNATMVFTIKGKNLMNKVSEKNINSSLIFQEFKKEMRITNLSQMSDLGFDFNSDFCFAIEPDTNMVVYFALIPIKNTEKFETLASNISHKNALQYNGYKATKKPYGNEMIAWNKDYAVFISGNYVGSLYQKSYSNQYRYNYYKENKAIEQVLKEDSKKIMTLKGKSDRVDEIIGNKKALSELLLVSLDNKLVEEDEIEEIIVIDETAEIETVQEQTVLTEVAEVEEIIETEVVEIAAEEAVVEEIEDYNYSRNTYYKDKSEIKNYRSKLRKKIKRREAEIRKIKKNKFVNDFFNYRLKQIFNVEKIENSIVNKASFKKSIDKKADGVLWVKNNYFESSLNNLMNPGYSRYSRRRRRSNLFRYGSYGILSNSLSYLSGGTSITKLYFENDGIRLTNTSVNSVEKKQITNAIYSTSQDSRFFKYINGDDFIGYFSTSISSKALVKEMPKIWTNIYSQYLTKNAEELDVLKDLLEVFMDEEAIGKLVTGNMMFVLKDLKQKEVKYSTYEYDENHNYTKVEKTKTELLPEFLLMLTTENTALLNKIFKLGIKHRVITNNGNYYSTKNSKTHLPMDFFFVIKDGIVFLSTDENEIITIMKGGSDKGLDKKHIKIIKNNSQVVYYNNDKLLKLIPESNFRRRNKETFQLLKEYNCEDIIITSKAKKGNLVTEGFIKTPNNENNGALYLFNYINEVLKFSKH